MTAYRELETRFRRLNALRDATGMLHWDMSTMMPEGGAGARAEQLAALKVVCHEIVAAPDLGDLLDRAEAERDGLDEWQTANLAEMRRQWIHATALDARLVDAISRASTTCEQIWRK